MSFADPPSLIWHPGSKLKNLMPSVKAKGTSAPTIARDWLNIFTKALNWSLKDPKITEETRDYIKVSISDPLNESDEISDVYVRIFHRPKKLVMFSQKGSCCCGTCLKDLNFYAIDKGKWRDVTDNVWPKFPWKTSDHLEFIPEKRTNKIKVYKYMDMLISDGDGHAYTLKYNRRSGRFKMVWKDKSVPSSTNEKELKTKKRRKQRRKKVRNMKKR